MKLMTAQMARNFAIATGVRSGFSQIMFFYIDKNLF